MNTNKSAAQYFHEIKTDLKTKNRFFVEEEFNILLDKLIQDEQEQLLKSTIVYRARLYLEDDVYERYHQNIKTDNPFKGFNSEDSFVNLKGSKAGGRGNPPGITYLYVSTDMKTCALEVCNKRESAVSIAEIEICKELKILNLAKNTHITSGEVTNSIDPSWINNFKVEVSNEMNRPFFDENEYILTQYICEYVKHKGLDGVQYYSTCHISDDKNEGMNIVIFNYEKCKPVSSELLLMKNINVELQSFENKDLII